MYQRKPGFSVRQIVNNHKIITPKSMCHKEFFVFSDESSILQIRNSNFKLWHMRIIHFYIFIYSTCVEETKYPLCSGTSFCANKGDLKWCKSQPAADRVPLYATDDIKCNALSNNNEKSLKGQQIKKVTKGDGRLFNCLNRQDEDPFKKTETKKWQGNQPCDKKHKRRCLGQRSEKCINAFCKFFHHKINYI